MKSIYNFTGDDILLVSFPDNKTIYRVPKDWRICFASNGMIFAGKNNYETIYDASKDRNNEMIVKSSKEKDYPIGGPVLTTDTILPGIRYGFKCNIIFKEIEK